MRAPCPPQFVCVCVFLSTWPDSIRKIVASLAVRLSRADFLRPLEKPDPTEITGYCTVIETKSKFCVKVQSKVKLFWVSIKRSKLPPNPMLMHQIQHLLTALRKIYIVCKRAVIPQYMGGLCASFHSTASLASTNHRFKVCRLCPRTTPPCLRFRSHTAGPSSHPVPQLPEVAAQKQLTRLFCSTYLMPVWLYVHRCHVQG